MLRKNFREQDQLLEKDSEIVTNYTAMSSLFDLEKACAAKDQRNRIYIHI